eukprot:scaffold8602_cov196-Amphora_coffeaeformis.AAC.18
MHQQYEDRTPKNALSSVKWENSFSPAMGSTPVTPQSRGKIWGCGRTRGAFVLRVCVPQCAPVGAAALSISILYIPEPSPRVGLTYTSGKNRDTHNFKISGV